MARSRERRASALIYAGSFRLRLLVVDLEGALLRRCRESAFDARLHLGHEDAITEPLPTLLGLVNRDDRPAAIRRATRVENSLPVTPAKSPVPLRKFQREKACSNRMRNDPLRSPSVQVTTFRIAPLDSPCPRGWFTNVQPDQSYDARELLDLERLSMTIASRREGRTTSETVSRRIVEELFRAIAENDVELFHTQFAEDGVIEFPQSGERIVGDLNRRAVYSSFPGQPTVTRIITGGHLAVVEATVDYGDSVEWRAVFICECQSGKIAKVTAYWAKPFEAAESRRPNLT